MSEKMTSFTLVFAGNIRDYKLNPLVAETPYGIPYAVGVGDAFEEGDALRELLAEAMDSRAPDYVDCQHPGWSERAAKLVR